MAIFMYTLLTHALFCKKGALLTKRFVVRLPDQPNKRKLYKPCCTLPTTPRPSFHLVVLLRTPSHSVFCPHLQPFPPSSGQPRHQLPSTAVRNDLLRFQHQSTSRGPVHPDSMYNVMLHPPQPCYLFPLCSFLVPSRHPHRHPLFIDFFLFQTILALVQTIFG